MSGVITQEHIDEIRKEFGDEVADAAEVWHGTFLELLKHLDII